MGLWLKCPHCLTANPLDLKACANCGATLENLPTAKRVYIFDKKAPAPPKPAAKPHASKAEAPEAAAGEAAPKKEASGESAPKRAKGSKSRQKKQ